MGGITINVRKKVEGGPGGNLGDRLKMSLGKKGGIKMGLPINPNKKAMAPIAPLKMEIPDMAPKDKKTAGEE